tara:strand:+ start:409 stop:633 length:225 start_codon:yes stop_codon:yes gene_type:complete
VDLVVEEVLVDYLVDPYSLVEQEIHLLYLRLKEIMVEVVNTMEMVDQVVAVVLELSELMEMETPLDKVALAEMV